MRRHQVLRAATVLAALAATAGLAACSQPSAPTSQAPGAGIAPGEPAPQEIGQPAEHPGEGTGFGKCSADTLSMRVEYHGDEDVARSADLFIANVGTKACNLPGYPELALYDANNQPVSIPAEPMDGSQHLLEIKPGERFTAPLGWSSSPESSPCVEPKTVGVTPPLTSDVKQIPWTGGVVCRNGISISPYERA
ncbi:DUF4232 domain-containing protein [Saccharopolyspora sp. K220]|uniref:DUF4232 domain-containing protein n=1 Tax=Saccharopolyspora soli TaxID=2926618 RepID=UPI001F59B9F8|nr:DUF4232 domain-containing protein [Saccharopolyspora soli]MCI2420010.1 DUF4232 domain-containing protein [Saccharopolyspora soli]